ncbi:MAG TPA: hypothetical protein VKZ59_09745 [Acidobacteriota bacterium]|nr:hypothetical protein [Acidobacteriota bacterium]
MVKQLLSKTPSKFKFPVGAKVRAPLFVGCRNKAEGTIIEGIYDAGLIFYEIEMRDNRQRRFAAREEDVEPL